MKISKFLALLALAVLPLASIGCKGKTYNIDGHEVSKSEVEEGFDEVAVIVRGLKPGDPSGLDLSYEPKTVVGRKMKEILTEMKSINDDAEKDFAGIDAEAVLTPERLTTVEGRARSRTETKILEAAEEKVMMRTTAYIAKVQALLTQLEAKTTAVDETAAENEHLMGLSRKMYAKIYEILDHVDRTKPKLLFDSLVFDEPSHSDKLDALLEELEEAGVAFEKEQTRILASRAASFQENMKFFSGEQ